jgi:hypothetical protein
MKFVTVLSICFLIIYLLIAGCNTSDKEKIDLKKQNIPIKVMATEKKGFATFTNDLHPGNSIGYRFFEHSPLTHGTIPESNVIFDPELNKEKIDEIEQFFSTQPDVYIYKKAVEQKDDWIKQDWTFYLAPVHDGIDLLLVVKTYDQGLPAYHGIQQCFRMSGKTNEPWRQKVATTPAFSEYDLWDKEKEQVKKTSLTYVLRKSRWQELPALPVSVGARTPFGLETDLKRHEGILPKKVGPYKAEMVDPIDLGLIARINLQKSWVSGIYWEGSSHVTDHHPADCLHCIVNIGNIPANSRRAIRGKIYWFKGSLDDLISKFEKDFQKNK